MSNNPLDLVEPDIPAMGKALAATMTGADAYRAFIAQLAKSPAPFYAAPDGEGRFIVAVPMDRRTVLVDAVGLAAHARYEASLGARKRFDEICDSQGWNETTQLKIVRDFVEDVGLDGLLACFAGDRAER
jgi:hypothetical protein